MGFGRKDTKRYSVTKGKSHFSDSEAKEMPLNQTK